MRLMFYKQIGSKGVADDGAAKESSGGHAGSPLAEALRAGNSVNAVPATWRDG